MQRLYCIAAAYFLLSSKFSYCINISLFFHFAKIGRKTLFKTCYEPPLFKIDILQPCQQLQEQKLYIYSSRFLLELNSNITKSENLLLQTILQGLISFICGHNIIISSS